MKICPDIRSFDGSKYQDTTIIQESTFGIKQYKLCIFMLYIYIYKRL